VLGDVEAEVVISAFGYFNPDVVRTMWNTGREHVAPREAARAHFACGADLGRAKLAGVEGLESYCAAADAVNQAADYVGFPLYAGFRGEPLVDDLPGRAMQLTAVLREFRGGAHLVAVRASGLSARTAHFVTRPNDGPMFGWPEDGAPSVSDQDRQAMVAAELLTDAMVRPAYAVLDEAGADALATGAERIAAALAG
jgi:hypothetical protein